MVIAEYDGSGNLLRKYVHAGTDRPICAIEVVDNNAVSYYHYDGLGSVVALSDSSGDTIQTYEYAIYGRVAAEDANHPNPYMFTGQRFDIETGLYYYKARYYNPHVGRFMQTDPIGYDDGINWYRYCGNNPGNRGDPTGCHDVDWPHFHVTLPVDAFTDEVLLSDLRAEGFVDSFFACTGFFFRNPGWDTEDVTLDRAGQKVDVVFGYRVAGEKGWEQPTRWPRISWHPQDVRAGRCTTNDPHLYYVDVVYEDNVGLLSERTLWKLIRPAIEMVNNRANAEDTTPGAGVVRFLFGWDSFFHEATGAFWWRDNLFWSKYSGDDINYAVGGYLAWRYGFDKRDGRFLVRLWKATGHFHYSPWFDMSATYYWFNYGYDNGENGVWGSWEWPD